MSTRGSTLAFGEMNGTCPSLHGLSGVIGTNMCSGSTTAGSSNGGRTSGSVFGIDQRRMDMTQRRGAFLEVSATPRSTPPCLGSYETDYGNEKYHPRNYEDGPYEYGRYGEVRCLEKGYEPHDSETSHRGPVRVTETGVGRPCGMTSTGCAFCTLGCVALVVMMLASGALLFHMQQEQLASMHDALTLRSTHNAPMRLITQGDNVDIVSLHEGRNEDVLDRATLQKTEAIPHSEASSLRLNRHLDWSSVARAHPWWTVGRSQQMERSTNVVRLDSTLFEVDSFVFAARPIVEEWIAWYETFRTLNTSRYELMASPRIKLSNRTVRKQR